ncbi:MAG: hypothetical protein ACKN9W_11995 [Methylococcus sp.]
MNGDVRNLSRELEWIRKNFPMEVLVHVGAGRGAGSMHQWQSWDIPHAVLIEPLIKPDVAMQHLLRQNPGWQWLENVLSDNDDEADFFKASNPLESGLLDPKRLQTVWPNLRVTETHRVSTRRLDSLLEEIECNQRVDWLLVDCLPALTILRGAGNRLVDCQVIWVRGVLDGTLQDLPEATISEIENYLKPLCFRRAVEFEGLHPAMGEAIFVRDWPNFVRKQVDDLCLTHEQDKDSWQSEKKDLLADEHKLRQLNKELVAVRDELVQELTDASELRHRLAQQANEIQQQLEAARQDNVQLASVSDALAQQDAALSQARDAEAQAKAEAHARIGQLEQAWQELVTARDALAQQNAALSQARDAEAQAKAEALAQRDVEAQAKAEAQVRIGQLEQAQQELVGARDALAQQYAVLSQARDAEAQAKAEALAQRDAEAQAKAETQARIGQLEQAQQKLVTARDALAQQNAALSQARDAEAQAKAEALAQRDAEAQAKAEAQGRIGQLEQAWQELVAARDALAQQNAALSKTRDTEAQSKAEATERIAELEQEISDGLAQYDALFKEKQKLDNVLSETKAAAERMRADITDRELELAECRHRQQLMNDELLKAEAQIELIKDLLLREPGL